MISWRVTLSNGNVFTEDSIVSTVDNPNKVTPWVLLEQHCKDTNVTITSIVLWDTESHRRVFSPGAGLGTLKPDSIDFRRRVISGLGSGSSTEFTGIIIKKDGASFGVWVDNTGRETYTTLEPY